MDVENAEFPSDGSSPRTLLQRSPLHICSDHSKILALRIMALLPGGSWIARPTKLWQSFAGSDIPRNRSKSSADWKWWNQPLFFRGHFACIPNHYSNSGWFILGCASFRLYQKLPSPSCQEFNALARNKKKTVAPCPFWRFPKIGVPKKHPKPDHSSCGDPPFWEPPIFWMRKIRGFSHDFSNPKFTSRTCRVARS